MSTNDISVRPAKQQILIGDTNIVHYGTSKSDSPNRVRRTQAFILKPEGTSVIWPGSYLEIALPSDLQPECTLAIESRTDNVKFLNNWTPPSIIEAVSGKVRIPNNTDEPLSLRKKWTFLPSLSHHRTLLWQYWQWHTITQAAFSYYRIPFWHHLCWSREDTSWVVPNQVSYFNSSLQWCVWHQNSGL